MGISNIFSKDPSFDSIIFKKEDGTLQLQGAVFTLFKFLSHPNDLAKCARTSKKFAKAVELGYKMLLKPPSTLLKLVQDTGLDPIILTNKNPSQLFKGHPAFREQFVAFDALGLEYIETLVRSSLGNYKRHKYKEHLAYTTPDLEDIPPPYPHNFYATATRINYLIEHLKIQIKLSRMFVELVEVKDQSYTFLSQAVSLREGIESGLTWEQVADPRFKNGFSFWHARAAKLGVPFETLCELTPHEAKILSYRKDLTFKRLRSLEIPITGFALESILIEYPYLTPELLQRIGNTKGFTDPEQFRKSALRLLPKELLEDTNSHNKRRSFYYYKVYKVIGIPFEKLGKLTPHEAKLLLHRPDLDLKRIRMLKKFPLSDFAIRSLLIDYPEIPPESLQHFANPKFGFNSIYQFQAYALKGLILPDDSSLDSLNFWHIEALKAGRHLEEVQDLSVDQIRLLIKRSDLTKEQVEYIYDSFKLKFLEKNNNCTVEEVENLSREELIKRMYHK